MTVQPHFERRFHRHVISNGFEPAARCADELDGFSAFSIHNEAG